MRSLSGKAGLYRTSRRALGMDLLSLSLLLPLSHLSSSLSLISLLSSLLPLSSPSPSLCIS